MSGGGRDAERPEAPGQGRLSGPPIRRGITWDADFYRGAKRKRPAPVHNDAGQRDGRDAECQQDEGDR